MKLLRNPDVNWRTETHREQKALEVLEDPVRGEEDQDVDALGTVTLLSGGVMHQLNLLGGEVWKMCDGSRDRESMAGELAAAFEADREVIREDLDIFLDDMIRMGLIHEE
jgi:pyrroloquinoline quinone biosynthesis protein D